MKKAIFILTAFLFLVFSLSTASAMAYTVCDSTSLPGSDPFICSITSDRLAANVLTQDQINNFWTAFKATSNPATTVIWKIQNARVNVQTTGDIYFSQGEMPNVTWNLEITRTSGTTYLRNQDSGHAMYLSPRSGEKSFSNITIDAAGTTDGAYIQGYDNNDKGVHIKITGILALRNKARIYNMGAVEAGQLALDNSQMIRFRGNVQINGNLTMSNSSSMEYLNNGNGNNELNVAGNAQLTNSRIHFHQDYSGPITVGGNLNITGLGPGDYSLYNAHKIKVTGNMALNGAYLRELNRQNKTGSDNEIQVGGKLTSTASSIYFGYWDDEWKCTTPMNIRTLDGGGGIEITGKYGDYAVYCPGDIVAQAPASIYVHDISGNSVWAQAGSIIAHGSITIQGPDSGANLVWDGWDNGDGGGAAAHNGKRGITEIRSATGDITIKNAYMRTIQGMIKAPAGKLTLQNKVRTDSITGNYSIIGIEAKNLEIKDARVYDITHDAATAGWAGIINVTESATFTNVEFPDSTGDDTQSITAKNLTMDNCWIFNIDAENGINVTEKFEMKNNSDIEWMGQANIAPNITAGQIIMTSSEINSKQRQDHMVGEINAGKIWLDNSVIYLVAKDISVQDYLYMKNSAIRFYDNLDDIDGKWATRNITINAGTKTGTHAIYIEGGKPVYDPFKEYTTYANTSIWSTGDHASPINIINNDLTAPVEFKNTLVDSSYNTWEKTTVQSCPFTGGGFEERSKDFYISTDASGDQFEINDGPGCGADNCGVVWTENTACSGGGPGTKQCNWLSTNPASCPLIGTACSTIVTGNYSNTPATTVVNYTCKIGGTPLTTTVGALASPGFTCNYPAADPGPWQITVDAVGVDDDCAPKDISRGGGPPGPGTAVDTVVYVNGFIMDKAGNSAVSGTASFNIQAEDGFCTRTGITIAGGLLESSRVCSLVPGKNYQAIITITANDGKSETVTLEFNA